MKRRDFLRIVTGGSLLFVGRALKIVAPGAASVVGGCGVAETVATALCVPCGFVVALAVGIFAVVGIFLLQDDDDNCDCRPPPEPTPPPEPPPPSVRRNWFCLQNVPTSECPIDGIWVEDPDDPLDQGTWIYLGPQTNSVPGHPEFRQGPALEQMIHPDRSDLPAYRNLDWVKPLVYFGAAGVRWWMTWKGRVHIVVHWNHNGNPENPQGTETDISLEMQRLGLLAPGQHPEINFGDWTFGVEWHSVRGRTLVYAHRA